ncbi:MAG TPA: HAMP domain-containing sensor histidine kinase [Solirubrobacterales bacterium]|jgi:two-component system sensor histidine kinase MtrB|nr:HAMP domain-containing sensor histidine kinase [Solirubrobacterales bacterium]
MAVGLAEVAAGLPMAASLALAGGITSLREGRRRAALNEAVHELRRPLQVLSLALPADAPAAAPVESSLQLATVALDRLDREINGASLEEVVTEVSVSDLIEDAAQRWRRLALDSGGSLEVDRNGEDIRIEGNRFDLAQALDNLLSNAIEHGGGQVRIGWRCEGSWVRLSVTDSGASAAAKTGGRKSRPKRRGRRGHGLRVVGRIARKHGGSFTLCRGPRGAEASLRLPLRRAVGEE